MTGSSSLRLMAVGAHPADPVERAGGTIAKHVLRGDVAMLVSHTAGTVTHAFDSFPATGADKLADLASVTAAKHAELQTAAGILGVQDARVLDFPESPMLLDLGHYLTMVELIREFRPDVVLCAHPTEVGRHDHMDSGRFTIAAVDYARAEGFPSSLAPHAVPHLFMSYYEDYRTEQLTGSPRHSPEVVIDTSAVIDRKRAAMLAFAGTQARPGEDYAARLDRFFAAVDGSAGYANGFGYAERFNRWNPQRVQYLPLD
jgi:N-acetylglucosamine malate deacetylase 1